MTNNQPPLILPSEAAVEAYEGWTDRELLIAMVVRTNNIAGQLAEISQQVPAVMGSPMFKLASKMLVRPDKSNE